MPIRTFCPGGYLCRKRLAVRTNPVPLCSHPPESDIRIRSDFRAGDSCNLWRPETNLHFRNREYRQSRRDHVSGGYPETDGTHAGKHRHLATGGGKRIARHHAGNRLLGATPADYVVVKQYIESRYPSFLHLIVHAPVCRPGWLIETECIAVIPADAPQYAYL